jgi:hypothetical protein
VRGGRGLERFRRRRAGSWTGSGWGASGGGEEVVGSWDLGGVERSRRIPARECGGGLGVARRNNRKAGGGKGSVRVL